MKQVILITGTPCVGKTTVAVPLAGKLGACYINLTDFVKTNDLVLGKDEGRNTLIIDEEKTRKKLAETIEAAENTVIIVDGHYASAIVSTQYAPKIFVLRRNPKELKSFMQKRGYSGNKLWENIQAEILDICLGEALQVHAGNVCEIDVTNKPVEKVVDDILDLLDKRKSCLVGGIDWMSVLEREGILDEYLRNDFI